MPFNRLILCHPLLFLPSIFPSIRVFSNESVLHIRWPKYWSFSFNISPSSEYSRLIFFRMDWLDLLAVQGTLKSPTPSSKASILWRSAFFIAQLLHLYMTTGKTIALTRWAFVGKVMSLLLVPTSYLFYTKLCIYVGATLSTRLTLFPLLCPLVHSLHLCFYSYPANKFISTTFLNSIYMSIPLICYIIHLC